MAKPSPSPKDRLRSVGAVLVWLVVWHLAALALNQPIFLVSPVDVLIRIVSLVQQPTFWLSVGTSLSRIVLGFVCALLAGVLLAGASAASKTVRSLLAPVVGVVRAAPVASFIILVLVWVSSRELSVVISFLMAFPMIYANVLAGIDATPESLLEMADVFRMGFAARLRSIYLSSCMPYLRTAASTAFGFAWKAGVAAEVIGLPKDSIGEQLYNAKIFLDTGGVLAWTVVIVALSVLLERLGTRALDALVRAIEQGD